MKILVPLVSPIHFKSIVDLLVERNWDKDFEIRVVVVIPFQQQSPLYTRTEKTNKMLDNFGEGVINGTVTALKNALPDAQVSGKVLTGDTVSSIAEEAEEWKPDLIIMCARERNWFLKFIFGEDIPEKLAKRVSCKVEVIKIV